MFTGKKVIIFDMDGTLIHSVGIWNQVDEELIRSGTRHCADSEGQKAPTWNTADFGRKRTVRGRAPIP